MCPQHMEIEEREIPGLDLLPVTEWEIPTQRKCIPSDIQLAIAVSIPVVRVSREICDKQIGKHGWLRPFFDDFDNVLTEWEILVPSSEDLWLILQHVELPGSNWEVALLTVIGRDRSHSLNLVSMHKRKESYFQRQCAEPRAIVRRR